MSTTVREALLNAQINFETAGKIGMPNPFHVIAKEQLDNALEALSNGMGLDDVIHEALFDEVKTKP